MQRSFKLSALMVGLLGAASYTHAAENDLGIYGFLSVGSSVLDNDLKNDTNGDGVVNADDAVTLDGFDGDAGNFKQDTVLGLQIIKQINDTTSATGQLVSRGTSNYDTESAWVFVTYSANPDLDLRMGRLRIPFFYYSEFLEVGYAYNWVRTPSDVYNLPFSSFDGVDMTQRFSMGNFDGDIKLNYGRFSETMELFGSEYQADLRNIAGISLNLTRGDFGLRLSSQRAEVTFDTVADITSDRGLDQAQAGALSAINLLGKSASVADDFTFKGKEGAFYGVALTYNDGEYGLVAEGTAIEYETGLLLDNLAWLISGSKRFNDFTAHATYSTSKDILESGDVGDVQEALGLKGEDISTILGVRYDYDAGTAIKFEVEHHDEKVHNAVDGNSAMLYSVAVDVIF